MNIQHEFVEYALDYVNEKCDKLHMLSMLTNKEFEKEFDKKTNIDLKNKIFDKLIDDLYDNYELVCNYYFYEEYNRITETDCLMYCIVELLLKYYIFELYENKYIFNTLNKLYKYNILYYYDNNIDEPIFVSLLIDAKKKINIIKKNNIIKREYARVINNDNPVNEFSAFFNKYCGLKKFIGTKLLLYLP